MRGRSLLGIVLGVLAALAAGCGDDDGATDRPDADAYEFDSGTKDGGTTRPPGGRRDGGQIGSGGRPSTAGSGAFAGSGPISGGVSGGAGVGAGGRGPSGSVVCDGNGTCLYPGGLVCFADGQCCYTNEVVDGYCCVAGRCQLVPPWVGVPVSPPDAGPPEPWVPPFDGELIGEPGWRDSEEPLCFTGTHRSFAQGVWSDSRGVFVSSVIPEPYDPMDPNSCFNCLRERVDFNDGSGWREIEGVWKDDNGPIQEPGLLLVTGFQNGPLVLYGYPSRAEDGRQCGISVVNDGMRTCQSADVVTDVEVVSDTLAYALLQGRMVRYDGANWGPLPVQMPAVAELQLMWADANVAMITAYAPGTIYTLRDGAFTIEDTRTLETFLGIFGFAPNDVFAGTWQGGLFHYDGMAWTKLDVPAVECGEPPVYSMWGANGILYFVTQSAFMRWNGTSVEKLAQLDCGRVASGQLAFTTLWGNSENEVFVGLTDTQAQTTECGATFMLHWDGAKFHQM